MMRGVTCPACGTQFSTEHYRQKYCADCHAPVFFVYRFVCPDGRSYVGSSGRSWSFMGSDSPKVRAFRGLLRSNKRIKAAAEKHPTNTWRFEVLEQLPLASSDGELRQSEQRHIERLGTLDPDRGFNVRPAVFE